MCTISQAGCTCNLCIHLKKFEYVQDLDLGSWLVGGKSRVIDGHHLLSFLVLVPLFHVICFSSSDGRTIPLSLCSSWGRDDAIIRITGISRKFILICNSVFNEFFFRLFPENIQTKWGCIFVSSPRVCMGVRASSSEGFFLHQGCLPPPRTVPQKSEVWPYPSCNWLDSDSRHKLEMSLLSHPASCCFSIWF